MIRPPLCLRGRKKFRGIWCLSGVNRSVTRELPEQALLQIYGETIRPLYRFVSKRVGGDAALAEDLVQDTWMRALDAWPAKGVPDEPLAWLVRVARNSLIDHFRRVTPQLVDPARLDLENEAFSPDAPDLASVVSWGLARLRHRHARLLEAFYFEGRTTREIAAEWKTSERAVEGALRRARAKLKKTLKPLMRPLDPAKRRVVEGASHAGPTRSL
jgi:RNA polymerase sigma factor (sigma-70 family)